MAPTCRAPALLLALLALLPAGQCLLPLPQPTVGAAYIAAEVRLTSRSQLGYLLSSLGPSGWTSRNFLVPYSRPQPHAARLLCCALGLQPDLKFASSGLLIRAGLARSLSHQGMAAHLLPASAPPHKVDLRSFTASNARGALVLLLFALQLHSATSQAFSSGGCNTTRA